MPYLSWSTDSCWLASRSSGSRGSTERGQGWLAASICGVGVFPRVVVIQLGDEPEQLVAVEWRL